MKSYGRWTAALALGAMALAGCGDGKEVRIENTMPPEQREAARAMVRQMRGEGVARGLGGQPVQPRPESSVANAEK